MLAYLKKVIKKLPPFRAVFTQRDRLQSELSALQTEFSALQTEFSALQSEFSTLQAKSPFVPPGHFYSPIPDIDEIRKDEKTIFGSVPRKISGIELHEEEQLKLLARFAKFYEEMPFQAEKSEGLRYFFKNPAYGYCDAILLHCMIRFLKPKRIMEVGSGFSSCMMLDTNEFMFANSIETTFIEPYPDLLLSLVKGADKERIRVIPSRLQDVDLSEFRTLEENDILFIDSTHVSRIHSDVNRAFFEILPRLAPGVHIHFHDIFFPFEYPKSWVYEGRSWNEAYLLRAFLQYNNQFRIVLMNTFMEHFHRQFFQEKMPLCLKNTGGSIWIRKE